MTSNGTHHESPVQVSLRQLKAQHPLPLLAPGTVEAASMAGEEPSKKALAVLEAFNSALAADDAKALDSCFFPRQALWRDQLALTYHYRTFAGAGVVSSALLETRRLRGLEGGFELHGTAQFIPATPVFQFIDFDISFRTGSPAATCRGMIKLLPLKIKNEDGTEVVEWRIWILSTILGNLDVRPEDEALLQAPRRNLQEPLLETDVFIIGGGNAAVALSARLKALGVDSIMAERNARPGDNWKNRYDCMKFHVPTSFCELPYMGYGKELQSPHLLTKDELGDQVYKYVEAFNLNVINSASIQSTTYDESTERWTVKFQTPVGERVAVSKHLVQATGFGSQKPHVPDIADRHLYKGISMHSSQYKNAKLLKEQGAKSALVVGSANTAFDVLEDCHAAGLHTTMNARSPTYLMPLSYLRDSMTLGAYDAGVDIGDRIFQTYPAFVDAQLAGGLFSAFASRAGEPERYRALAEAGFRVFDSAHPDSDLLSNLLERAGGHYLDPDGAAVGLIAERRVGLKADVEPVAFTDNGVRFSDGSTVEVDAVVWCTGFADSNVRYANDVLSRDLAARLDATWGLDAEGEIRGMWKRHVGVDNYWAMGGFTSQHRWHSRLVALQIRAALDGVLPPAYRETPEPRGT